jgi:NAD(P)-dependent dehydrogenase (short-subunit alcohol dehydrogenase family)
MTKTWFITGANRGFGREFARAALGRGDRVAGTSRKLDGLTDLVPTIGEERVVIQGVYERHP